MTTDTALIEKREDLKRRLAAGEYKTLVDIFLGWFERLIRKVIRRKDPLPLWVITIILGLTVNVILYGGVYITGEWTMVLKIIDSLRLGHVLGFLFVTLGIILSVSLPIVSNQRTTNFFVLWHDETLHLIESASSLNILEIWIKKSCNKPLHFITTIALALAFSVLTEFGMTVIGPQVGLHNGWGLMFASLLLNLIIFAFVYPFVMIIILAAKLRQYNLKLFIADPSSSSIISSLTNEFNSSIYTVAFYGVIGLISFGLLPGTIEPGLVIFQIFMVWIPIIALFTSIQTSLASIVRRAKWKTLNEIQSQVEELRATNNLKDKETMESINRLMDFHDRVKATRNSAIDSGTILNFINSLLLPLIAFLLGNLDKVVLLFTKKP